MYENGKVLNIERGKILVASDLQGNLDDYRRVRDRFDRLRRKGKADILVLDGDLIHGYPGYQDRSVEILDDLIDNPLQYVIALLGNHELMHIYHMNVSKGERNFTGFFEDSIRGTRERYVGFMKQMPYAIRTAGGVLINHTGANPPVAGFTPLGRKYEELVNATDGFNLMDGINHDDIIRVMRSLTEKRVGEVLDDVNKYHPEIGETFIQNIIGEYFWDVFFNKNEYEYGESQYIEFLESFLNEMSRGWKKQNFLVSGHIEVPEGYKIVGRQQLRICTGYGTEEPEKVLALVDSSKKYHSASKLVNDLISLN